MSVAFAAARTIFRRTRLAVAAVARSPSQITRVTYPTASLMESKGPSAAAARLSTSVGDSNGRIRRFELSSSSSLVISKGDITVWSMDGSNDAIVNAANNVMLGGGGVDGAIHRAAGPDLKEACWNVPEVQPGVRCPTGEARITPGFRLPVSQVIHTVGPIYDEEKHPEVSLRNSYRSCFKLAKENGIQYIAFPAISCGVYGYPYKEAATIAVTVVKELASDFKEAHFVLFSDDIYKVWLDTANELI